MGGGGGSGAERLQNTRLRLRDIERLLPLSRSRVVILEKNYFMSLSQIIMKVRRVRLLLPQSRTPVVEKC